MEKTNKKSNKLIKSKKYQGIYYKKTTHNDKMYYIETRTVTATTVRLKSSGINELYCYNLRNEEINKVRLNENPKLSSKQVIVKFDEIAFDYFENMRLSLCSDYKNSYNKYKNHIKPVFGNINIKDITKINK